jgi:hypothetical protein
MTQLPWARRNFFREIKLEQTFIALPINIFLAVIYHDDLNESFADGSALLCRLKR